MVPLVRGRANNRDHLRMRRRYDDFAVCTSEEADVWYERTAVSTLRKVRLAASGISSCAREIC